MLQVQIGKTGYTAVDEAGQCLWRESGLAYFFRFLEADASNVELRLSAYYRSVIDDQTLEADAAYADLEALSVAREALFRVHPFLYYNQGGAILLDMLGCHLVSSMLAHPEFETEYNAEWFAQRMGALVHEPLDEQMLASGKSDIRDEMEIWPVMVERYGINLHIDLGDRYDEAALCEWWYNTYLAVKAGRCKKRLSDYSMDCIAQLQAHVRREVYWMIDLSTKRFDGLSRTQRAMLYRGIFSAQTDAPDAIVERWASFANRREFGNKASAHIATAINLHEFSDYPYDADDYTPLNDEIKSALHGKGKFAVSDEVYDELKNLSSDSQPLDPNTDAAFQEMKANAARIDAPENYTEYNIRTLYKLLYLQMEQIVANETIVKRCRLCGRYFTSADLKIEYCDNIAIGESKPCTEIGSIRLYTKRLQEDEALNIYNRAYKTHFARVKKGKMLDDDWARWRKEAKEKLDAVRAGHLEMDDFEIWLKI